MTTFKQLRNEKLAEVKAKELAVFAERLLLVIPKMLDKYPLKTEFYLATDSKSEQIIFKLDQANDLILRLEDNDLLNLTKLDKLHKIEEMEFFKDCEVIDSGSWICVKIKD